MVHFSRLLLLSGLSLSLVPRAETVKDREGAVRADRAAMEGEGRWIYNDVDRGFAEAKRSGKPLLVVIRCVPCLSCKGMDAAILESKALEPLLDRFVCVRVINVNTLDLARFQFDYDLSFSTLIFNGDGTVYGRFGSWKHQRDPGETSLAGYQAALGAALSIHGGYPANRAALAGKQGGPATYKVPVEMPTLAGKYGRELDWQGKVVPSCVHCHQIGDAHRAAFRDKGQPIPSEWIYPMPPPETIGLTLNPDTVARVSAVEAGSPASAAGFKPGDDLLAANGAPLMSAADLAWALHRSTDPGTLRLLTRRAGAERELVVKLEPGWRGNVDISTRVGTWPMRAMAFGGLKLESVPTAERVALKVPSDGLALRLHHVGQYGKHAAAKNAGFRKDDVLVAVEGIRGNLDESQLIGRLLAAHPTPAKVKATVLREGKRVELLLPVQ